jgi:hypothetical protein
MKYEPDKDEIDQCSDDLVGRLRVIADQVGAVVKEMEPVARGGDLDYQPNVEEIRDWKDRLQYLCGRLHGTAMRLEKAGAATLKDGKL